MLVRLKRFANSEVPCCKEVKLRWLKRLEVVGQRRQEHAGLLTLVSWRRQRLAGFDRVEERKE